MTGLYFLILGGTLLLSLLASSRVRSAYARYSQVRASSGLSGAEVARRILDLNGIYDVTVHATEGHLTDHYDPSNKRLVLSEENYHGTSVAALGIAAHEAGHAIQHKQAYGPLQWRMAAVGITQVASQAILWIPLIGGFTGLIPFKIAIAIMALAFGVMMLFQLITLPVEFDATARAKRILAQTRAVAPGPETQAMNSVLDAAALTYVAAFISSLSWFLYHLLQMQNSNEE